MVSLSNFLSPWHNKHKFQGFFQSGSMEWNWISVTSSFTNLEISKLSGFLQKECFCCRVFWHGNAQPQKWIQMVYFRQKAGGCADNNLQSRLFKKNYSAVIWRRSFPFSSQLPKKTKWRADSSGKEFGYFLKKRIPKETMGFWVVSNHPFWRKSLVLSLEPLGVVEKPSLFSEGQNHGTFPQLWAASTPFLPYQSSESGHFDLGVWGMVIFCRKITK